ncbi:hypothetical protein GCM10010195_00830 [Kitasatospora griseola]|nr:hypothetical protein GCM10010195_00830 [Kitasatospora griseola]
MLAAMGVLTEGNVRVSLPPGTAAADVDRFLDVLPRIVAEIRAPLGLDLPAPAATADALVLDTLGRRCPVPVIELAKRIPEVAPGGRVAVLSDDEAAAEVAPGGRVAVLSDDEAARHDIPAWCEMCGHTYAGETSATDYGADHGTAYLVVRSGA